MVNPTTEKEDGGHAVVLIHCTPQCLVFMNSWGQEWGDEGFFRVKDGQVLDSIAFYDVYWTLNDLKQCEKDAYQRKALIRTEELRRNFPSIDDLIAECPLCRRRSRVKDFEGSLLKAICPSCWREFKPTNEDLVKSLYIRQF